MKKRSWVDDGWDARPADPPPAAAEGAPVPESACGPTGIHRQVAARMRARGFHRRQFVGACGEVERWAPGRSDKIEDVAVLHYLGYHVGERRAFVRHEMSLESFRLRDYRKMKRTGIILGLSSLPPLIAGGVIWARSSRMSAEYNDEDDGQHTDFQTLGVAIFAVGGLVALSGAVLGLVGGLGEKRSESPEGLLETGSFRDIRRWHRGELASSEDAARAPILGVALGPRSGGLSLRFSF